MPGDLGCIEGTREDRHLEDYQKHFPDGYRMEFVGYDDVKTHAGLMAAIEASNKLRDAGEETQKAERPGVVLTAVDDPGNETEIRKEF